MKALNTNIYYLTLCLLLCGFSGFGKITRSNGSGNLNISGTWDNGVPGVGDSAIVRNGDVVTVTSGVTVEAIILESSSSGTSTLIVNSGVTLVVSNHLLSTASGINETTLITNNGIITCQSAISFWGNGFTGLTQTFAGTGTATSVYLNVFSGLNGNLTVNQSGSMLISFQHYIYCLGTVNYNLMGQLTTKDLRLQSSVANNCNVNMDFSGSKYTINGTLLQSVAGGRELLKEAITQKLLFRMLLKSPEIHV